MKHSSQRIEYIDVMKGLGIILVIIGHCHIPSLLHHFIYSFHMPLFFFLSGVFFKGGIVNKNTWIKNFRSLIVPYLFCTFAVMLYWLLLGEYTEVKGEFLAMLSSQCSSTSYSSEVLFANIGTGVGVAWFFTALFWCRIIMSYLAQYLSGVKLSLIVLVLFLISYYGLSYFYLPLGITPGLISLPFFYMGYCAKDYVANINLKERINIFNSTSVFAQNNIAGLILLLLFSLWIYNHPSIYLSSGRFICWPIDMVSSCAGIFLIFQICITLRKNNHIYNVIYNFGRYSLFVLVVHSIEFKLNVIELYYNIGKTSDTIYYIVLITAPIVRIFLDCMLAYLLFILKPFNRILSAK